MTVTINGYVLNVKSDAFRESRVFFGFEWTRWNKTSCKAELQHIAFGWIGYWEFTAYEDANSVTWANSAANLLAATVDSGAAVSISMSAGAKHSVPAGQSVYIEEVSDPWYSDGMKTRYFNVRVRAA